MQHIPNDVLVFIHEYTVGEALSQVCRKWWMVCGHRRRTLTFAWNEALPGRIQSLSGSLHELNARYLDDQGAESLHCIQQTFTSLSRLHLTHDAIQPSQRQTDHLTEYGLMGIRHLIRSAPALEVVHLAFVMEARALAVAAWQLLMQSLPPSIRTLTLICFVMHHQHFFPLDWHLPVQGILCVVPEMVPCGTIWNTSVSPATRHRVPPHGNDCGKT